MEIDDHINVIVVSNEKYIEYTMVMLCSLFEQNPTENFRIFMLTDRLSDTYINFLSKLCHNYNSLVEILFPEEILLNKYGININDIPSHRWSPIIYYKLSLPIILPLDINKCIFLDSDLIINDSIRELIDYEMNDNEIIAACDDNGWCHQHALRLGMPNLPNYINSGVMLCDIKKWRILEQQNPILNFTKSVISKIRNEQDVIALYFQNRIATLPIKWNMTTFYYRRIPFVHPEYKNQLSYLKRNPSIIHFCEPIKPWFEECDHPLSHLYTIYYLKYCKICGINPSKPKKYFINITTLQKAKRNIRLFFNKHNIVKDPWFLTLD